MGFVVSLIYSILPHVLPELLCVLHSTHVSMFLRENLYFHISMQINWPYKEEATFFHISNNLKHVSKIQFLSRKCFKLKGSCWITMQNTLLTSNRKYTTYTNTPRSIRPFIFEIEPFSRKFNFQFGGFLRRKLGIWFLCTTRRLLLKILKKKIGITSKNTKIHHNYLIHETITESSDAAIRFVWFSVTNIESFRRCISLSNLT